jgi:hypothetical protein
MATAKISSTKSTARAINYAEKRAVEKSGVNCDVEYAKSSFKATRELYGKTGGNEGHVVIQSFQPGEVEAQKCNQLGVELAEKIAPNHQVSVYTHDDKDHMHNHIVINAVNLETGKKFNNNKKMLHDIRRANDELCKAYGLSVVEEQKAPVRYTQAEKAVLEKGQSSWKDEIRQAVDLSKSRTSDFESLQNDLGDLGIETKLRGSTVSYKHPDVDKWVRAKKLGSDYELRGLENEFTRQVESAETTISTSNDWEQFERETAGKRIVRSEKAKRTVERQDDRDREVARRTERADRQPVRKARERDDGLEL